MKHKLYNRLLSLALAVGLVVGMLPGVTFASAVDSDATALQSQVEQIAEPTEEPETVSEESSQAEATPTPAPESSEEESSQVEETPAPTEEPVQEPENNEDTESAFIPPVNYTNVAPLEEENSPALPTMNTMNLLSVGRENEDTTDNGLELAKAVTGNRDDGYQVKLEAYTTGTVTSTTSTKPADIVLVLDVSGSMAYCIHCGKEESEHREQETVAYTEAYDVSRYQQYYYYDGNSYRRVYYCTGDRWGSCDGGWFTQQHNYYWHSGTQLTPKTSASDTNAGHTQFYVRAVTETSYVCTDGSGNTFESRMDALRTAVDAFLDSVQESAKGKDGVLGTEDDVHRRVSFVKFASDNNEDIGNDTNRNGYNDSQQVTGLLDMTDSLSATTIMNELNDIHPAGATRADYGMNHAADILQSARQAEGYDRSQVAILFTDGQPTTSSDFSSTVAGATIKESSRIKESGGTVYTIGVFSGADGTVPEDADGLSNLSNINRYMHLVSSNFPDATGWEHYTENWWNPQDQWGELNPNLEGNDSYYLSANNSDDLTDIFESISGEISSPAVTLGTGTVIRDVVTDYFELPQSGQVTVQKYDKTLNSDNSIDWVLDQGWSLNRSNITVDTDNDAVNVTGIDLSKYFVSENPRENPDNASDDKYYGSKFVITFPIEVKDTFFGGNQVPTNEVEQSGVIRENETNVFEEFPDPGKQDVALDYQFDVQDQVIYISQSADLSDLISYAENYVPGTVLSDADAEKNNDYVNLVFTVKDTAGNVVGTYTVNAANSDGTWTWESDYSDENAKLTDCTGYQISCQVVPKESGSIKTNEGLNGMGDKDATVHVLIPKVSVTDTEIDLGQVANIQDNLVDFKDGDWKDIDNHQITTDAYPENAPSVQLGYTYVEGTEVPETGDYKPEQDSDFTVTVTVGELPLTKDQYDLTTKVIEHNNCIEPTEGNDHDFTIHVHTTNGMLVIQKKIEGGLAENGEPVFDFKVESPNGTVYYYHVIGQADGTVTATPEDGVSLPAGDYTVTELYNQNYEATGVQITGGDQTTTTPGNNYSVTVSVKPNGTTTVTFTNTADDTKIPSDSGATQNIPKWNSNNLVGWKPDDNIKDGDVQTDETSN